MQRHSIASTPSRDIAKATALKFVVLLGVVSLFGDMTYEGARSITGPFLAVLGASGTVVGIVAGFGELIGYGLRLVSGYISDRTGRYWTVTLIGYAINLLVVPLLALAGRWEIAALLMISERIGKGIRTPARDAMLSHATNEMGRGWGFGLHEAMDQTGAILGPLIVAAVLYLRGDYRTGFGLLLIPALLALTVLLVAWRLYPHPRDFEVGSTTLETQGYSRVFWFYLAAVALVAAGYVDFPLISYHFEKVTAIPTDWIPIFYAIAMGVDALAALLFGRLFDRLGIPVLALVSLISAFMAPLVFLGGFTVALLGMVLWGIGMGAQESIMRAAIGGMVPADRRGSAYGLFNTGYGLFWFLGSALMGVLYDISIPTLIVFSVIIQLASVPLFILVRRQMHKADSGG
ncbi:MAG: MFS transporter [Chloroflexi bacterium]|nr:MFS transporter [Chloroflexota bacterium]